jgi:cytochrome c oxidase cbb3-type subunit III
LKIQPRPALLLTLLLAFACTSLGAEKRSSNPLGGNPAAIHEGSSLFRANCSPCHGLNAKGGGRGPDLSAGRWSHGSSDGDIFRTISEGVPGTEMPANSFTDSEIWALVTYLRSLAPSKPVHVAGDPLRGQKLFTGTQGCSFCHMINGQGGVLGPDLSHIGRARSVASLLESIRDPDKELSDGILDPNRWGPPIVHDTVVVTTADGKELKGLAKNEDTFSLQFMDVQQNLHLYLKKDLKQVVHLRKSLMPVYSEQSLNAADLQDLIAYLVTLRGQ